MSKFTGLLPDIDAGQDVFETEDSPQAIGKDGYDSDDSIHRLRHLNAFTTRATAGTSGVGGRGGRGIANEKGADGSIDEGGLPRKGEVERMFRRGRKKSDGRGEATYTFRPRLPPLDPSHTTDEAASIASSRSTQGSSGEDDEMDEDGSARRERPTTMRRGDRTGIITREVAVARMRRLKLEMADLERGLRRSADQGEEHKPTFPQVSDAGEAAAEGKILDKDLVRPPPKPRVRQVLPSAGELMAQLSGMRTSLERVEVEVRLSDGKRGGTLGVGRVADEALLKRLEGLGEIGKTAEESQSQTIEPTLVRQGMYPAQDVAEFDTRLAHLERAIGANTLSADATLGGPSSTSTSSQPILPTLDRLENLINLLSQPRQLDSVSRRIKVLVADLDKVTAAAGRAGAGAGQGDRDPRTGQPASREASEGRVFLSIEDKDKVDTLFSLLPRIDPIIPIIPPLLTRLRSLSRLHAASSTFATTLERLEQESASMVDSEGDVALTVQRVEEGLKKQVEAIKGNWESLHVRIADVGKRVDALQN